MKQKGKKYYVKRKIISQNNSVCGVAMDDIESIRKILLED